MKMSKAMEIIKNELIWRADGMGMVYVVHWKSAPSVYRQRRGHFGCAGGETLQTISDTLTERGYQPKRGCKWHRNTVTAIIERYAKFDSEKGTSALCRPSAKPTRRL